LEKSILLHLMKMVKTVLEKVSVLNYIVYETFTGSTNYIHMEGKWYQIDRDFYLEITERAKDIEEIEDQNFLPPKPKDTIERVYNKKTCEDKGYLLLDTKLYYFGGYDKVEVCDILTPAYEFICVKPYSSSSTLSHLFSQGMVSGQLLTNLPAYKSKVQEQIESSDLGFGSLLEKENRDITFVFAIATIKKGKLVETLPFFSKLTLLEAYQALQGLGYIVKVFKIPVEE